MNCKLANELIMRCFDKNISQYEKVSLDEHINSCESCKEEFQIFSDIMGIMEDNDEVFIQEGFERNLMLKIEEIEKQKVTDGLIIFMSCALSMFLLTFTLVYATFLEGFRFADVFENIIVLINSFLYVVKLPFISEIYFFINSASIIFVLMFIIYNFQEVKRCRSTR